MTERGKRLATLGLEAAQKPKVGDSLTRVILGLAAMLDDIYPKPKQGSNTRLDLSSLPFGPGELYAELEKHCDDKLQLRPYDKSSFGRLGRVMKNIQGLEREDLDRVIGWIQSGGLASWSMRPTWNHVCKHFGNWVGYARAWDNGPKSPDSGMDAWR